MSLFLACVHILSYLDFINQPLCYLSCTIFCLTVKVLLRHHHNELHLLKALIMLEIYANLSIALKTGLKTFITG